MGIVVLVGDVVSWAYESAGRDGTVVGLRTPRWMCASLGVA